MCYVQTWSLTLFGVGGVGIQCCSSVCVFVGGGVKGYLKIWSVTLGVWGGECCWCVCGREYLQTWSLTWCGGVALLNFPGPPSLTAATLNSTTVPSWRPITVKFGSLTGKLFT